MELGQMLKNQVWWWCNSITTKQNFVYDSSRIQRIKYIKKEIMSGTKMYQNKMIDCINHILNTMVILVGWNTITERKYNGHAMCVFII